MAASKNPALRLLHIRDKIEGASAALRDVSFEQYRDSYILRRTVERAVQIISEAVKALPAEYRVSPGIPWAAIAGIGNILRHEYQHIDDARLREIATVHLPQLQPVVLQMLARNATSAPP